MKFNYDTTESHENELEAILSKGGAGLWPAESGVSPDCVRCICIA